MDTVRDELHELFGQADTYVSHWFQIYLAPYAELREPKPGLFR
jgi:hypothetical protein